MLMRISILLASLISAAWVILGKRCLISSANRPKRARELSHLRHELLGLICCRQHVDFVKTYRLIGVSFFGRGIGGC
jgi:hypothetical protein